MLIVRNWHMCKNVICLTRTVLSIGFPINISSPSRTHKGRNTINVRGLLRFKKLVVVTDIDDFKTARMYLEAQPPVGGHVQDHHVALDMPSLLKSMTVPNGCNGTNVRSLAKLREPRFELGTNPKPLTALVNERPDLPIAVPQLHAASPRNVPREGPCTRKLRQKNSSAFSASIWRRSLCQKGYGEIPIPW